MNSLPDEILFQILYSLPGEDVSRFRRLNSRFNGIISTYRQSLRKPLISIKISGRTRKHLGRKDLLLMVEPKRGGYFAAQVRFFLRDDNTCDLHSIVTSKKPFFAPFASKGKYKTVEDLLLFLFSKGDISVFSVNSEIVREALQILETAIEKSDCRFLEVHLNTFAIKGRTDGVDGYLKCLQTIAEKEKRANKKGIPPVLKITELLNYRGYVDSSVIERLNILGARFPSTIAYIRVDSLCVSIINIIKTWEEQPIRPFIFRIELTEGDHEFGCKGYDRCDLSNLKNRMTVKIPESFLKYHTLASVPREMEFSNRNIPTRLRFRFQRMGTEHHGFAIIGRIDVLE